MKEVEDREREDAYRRQELDAVKPVSAGVGAGECRACRKVAFR